MFVSNVNNNKSLPSRSFCVLFLWPLCWTWSVVHVVGRLDLDGVRPVVSSRQNPATDVCHLPIKIINNMKNFQFSIFKLLLIKISFASVGVITYSITIRKFKWSFHTHIFLVLLFRTVVLNLFSNNLEFFVPWQWCVGCRTAVGRHVVLEWCGAAAVVVALLRDAAPRFRRPSRLEWWTSLPDVEVSLPRFGCDAASFSTTATDNPKSRIKFVW